MTRCESDPVMSPTTRPWKPAYFQLETAIFVIVIATMDTRARLSERRLLKPDDTCETVEWVASGATISQLAPLIGVLNEELVDQIPL